MAGAAKARGRLGDPHLLRAVVLVVALRIALGAVAVISAHIQPVTNPNGSWLQLRLSPDSPLSAIVEPWQRFDALWYDHIARDGYGAPGAEAFCPLYPGLVAVAGRALGGAFALAELLVSTVAAVIALWVLGRLVESDTDSRVARRTVLYTALAPTAFFLLAGYTESLFLALSAGMFLAARRRRFVLAGLLCGLAVLCRIQGVLLLVPLAVEAFLAERGAGPEGAARRRAATGAGLLLPVLTLIGMTLAFRAAGLGWGPIAAQQAWGVRLAAPWSVLAASLGTIATGVHPEETVNLLLALILVAALPGMARRLPASFTLYAAATAGLIWFHENGYSPLMSTARFLLVLFPLFTLIALEARKRAVHVAVLVAFSAGLVLLFGRFVHFSFVG